MLQRVLDGIERVGNKIPHPAVLFVILIGFLAVLSHLFYWSGATVTYEAIDPDTDQLETMTTSAQSLLTGSGIRFMYENAVGNFMDFTALGVVIVAMLGVGVAESSGLIKALIRKLVKVAPPKALTYIIVFVGILSSVAADAGYLVLIPLAASAYVAVGRHPLAGLAASFAGVAAVFGVNLLVKPADGILTEITNDAIHLVDPSISISITANWWFGAASVVMLAVLCALITDKIIEPRLGTWRPEDGTAPDPNAEDAGEREPAPEANARGLKYALWATLATLGVFALLALPPGAPLRNPETHALIGDSPFMSGLIVLITLVFFAAGVGYGVGARTFKSTTDVTSAMEKAIAGLAGLIFLLFFISQFVAYFSYSNLATLVAVKLGDVLESAGVGALPLLIGLVVVTLILDLFLSGIIPKWAIFAPVFVPLFLRLGVKPEAGLAAYRVGDSPFNVLSPLMPYFALIVTFAKRYQRSAGVGTLVALMMPYVVFVTLAWIVLLVVWELTGLPWGF
ncbi:MAG: AbgT family transporter [Kofleriaceae bacterium]|nr:AbgT family transporter [Kofleriaceae bacterium]